MDQSVDIRWASPTMRWSRHCVRCATRPPRPRLPHSETAREPQRGIDDFREEIGGGMGFWSVPRAGAPRNHAIGCRPRRWSSSRAGGDVAIKRIHRGGSCLVMVLGSLMAVTASGQESGRTSVPDLSPLPPREDGQGAAANPAALPQPPEPGIKPLMEGPLHEAFLSPRKDREPLHVEKRPRPRSPSARPSIPPAPRPSGLRLLGVGHSNT